jgi:hypothetical protein
MRKISARENGILQGVIYFNQKFFMLIKVFIYLAVEANGIHNELYARSNQIIHSK